MTQCVQSPFLPEAAAAHCSDGANISVVDLRRQFPGPPMQKRLDLRRLNRFGTVTISPQCLIPKGKDNLLAPLVRQFLQFDKTNGSLTISANHEKSAVLVKIIG